MKGQKRIVSLAVALVLSLVGMISMTGCTGGSEGGLTTEGQSSGGGKKAPEASLKVVTTIFPEYDWVREIAGEDAFGVEIILLQQGTDLHSYQPSAADILKIASADIFIYVGGESDAWVKDVVAQNPGNERQDLNLLEILGDAAKEEEVVEGMQEEPEEDSEDSHNETEPEYDEHVWLSVKNAEVFVRAIADAMILADPEHAAQYQIHRDSYLEELKELDGQFEEAAAQKKRDTLLFADRFPFRYLTEDYGLKYYAAFNGCSAETEATFQTVTFLSGKAEELDLHFICVIENSDGKLAQAVISGTEKGDQEILHFDSMQGGSLEEGRSYLHIMKENLLVLKKALGE